MDNNKNGGFVYILCDSSKDNTFKIGVTRGNIEKRIKKLQTGNSGEIFITSYQKCNHPFFVEKWLHLQYFGKKVLNEWFEMNIEDIKSFKTDCLKYDELYELTHNNRNRISFDIDEK